MKKQGKKQYQSEERGALQSGGGAERLKAFEPMVLMRAGRIARLLEDDDTKRWERGRGFGTKVELGVICMAMKPNIIFKETIEDGEGIEAKEDRTED